MATITRTPEKSSSVPDMLTLDDNMSPPSFISARNKRKRRTEISHDFQDMAADLKSDMKELFNTLSSTQNMQINTILTSLKDIQQTNNLVQTTISHIAEENKELKFKIQQLEAQAKRDKEQLMILENRIEDMQMGSRKANFEIKNVPKKSSETKDDLVDMVLCLSKNVGSSINKGDIRDIYRVRGKKEGTKNTPIIVETSSTLLKNDILKSSKAFNIKHKTKLRALHLGLRTSEDTPIFVSEQLTAKGSRLHYLARDLAKSINYKFCWTAYGKVYVRRDENSQIIAIKTEAQVQQLLQEQ